MTYSSSLFDVWWCSNEGIIKKVGRVIGQAKLQCFFQANDSSKIQTNELILKMNSLCSFIGRIRGYQKVLLKLTDQRIDSEHKYLGKQLNLL